MNSAASAADAETPVSAEQSPEDFEDNINTLRELLGETIVKSLDDGRARFAAAEISRTRADSLRSVLCAQRTQGDSLRAEIELHDPMHFLEDALESIAEAESRPQRAPPGMRVDRDVMLPPSIPRPTLIEQFEALSFNATPPGQFVITPPARDVVISVRELDQRGSARSNRNASVLPDMGDALQAHIRGDVLTSRQIGQIAEFDFNRAVRRTGMQTMLLPLRFPTSIHLDSRPAGDFAQVERSARTGLFTMENGLEVDLTENARTVARQYLDAIFVLNNNTETSH